MSKKTLKELFKEYETQNTNRRWIDNYREVCARVASIRDGSEKLTVEFAKHLWTDYDNGVTNTRAPLPADFFDKHQDTLLEMTRQLIGSPTPEQFEKVLEQWTQWKNAGVFPWIPWAASSRVLAAIAPRNYTSFVSGTIYDLFRYLRDAHGLTVLRTGNWATQSSNILKRVRAEGLQDADPIVLNTFLWWAYDRYTPAKAPSSPEESTTSVAIPPASKLPPLNTIFYGPPGTGKTYLMNQIKDALFTTSSSQLTTEQWEEELFGALSWWEVTAAALHAVGGKSTVPDLKKHPFVQAKLRTSNNRNLGGTLWESLPAHTPLESKAVNYDHRYRRRPFIFDKFEGSTWRLLDGWEELCPNIIETLDRHEKGLPENERVNRYEFITFHQSYSYEEFVEGIRPVLADDEAQGELGYELVDGVFKKLCIRARNNPDVPHALFIDEINRGNISKIFGELITLIEDSKRERGKEPLSVQLPYSRQQFSVPSNLHIIGTMNTADRSLALMDTALRRRFSFKEITPDVSLLEDVTVSEEGLTVNISKMLETMNRRIELLYDREHTIGHSFFMGQDWEPPSINSLTKTFSRKIVPLLQEYFFENWDNIRLVLADNQKERTDPGLVFVRKAEVQESDLFGDGGLNGRELEKYEFNHRALEDIRAYIGIYDPSVLGEREEGEEEG